MDLETYGLLVRRALEHGVPTAVVAEVFELDPAATRELQKEVLVTEYGTADQAEYLEQTQWKAMKRSAELIEHGSPADAARLAAAVFGRQIAAAGKRPSEKMAKDREELMETLRAAREGPAVPVGRPSRFVASAGAVEDE